MRQPATPGTDKFQISRLLSGHELNLPRAIVRSLGISKQDNVTIYFRPHTLKLAEETAEECFRKGADVLLNLYTDRYHKAYLTHLSEDNLKQPSDFCRVLTDTSTAQIWMGQSYDPSFFKAIPPTKLAADNEGEHKAHSHPRHKGNVRWLSARIGAVTKPRAKIYGLDYEKWRATVNQASLVDSKVLSKIGRKLASALNGAKKVTVAGPGGTNLRLSLKGRSAQIHDGMIDRSDLGKGLIYTEIPTGRVVIAPVETSAEGRAIFNCPIAWSGRTVRQLEWGFKHGRVIDFRGDSAAVALRRSWEKAEGNRDRIACLTVGINPKVKLRCGLDTIARGAISIGIGDNQDLKGRNRSTFFQQGTIGHACLTADGKTLVKDGELFV